MAIGASCGSASSSPAGAVPSPLRVAKDRPEPLLKHDADKCWTGAVRAFAKSFCVAYGARAVVSLARLAFLCLKCRGTGGMPPVLRLLFRALVSRNHAQFAAFVGSFAGVYFASNATLIRLRRRDDGLNAFVAGGLAGLTMFLDPGRRSGGRMALSLYALTRAVEFACRGAARRGWLPRVPHLDTMLFWASCTRIMYAWFYLPWTLAPLYVRWITRMAAMDTRLLAALRSLHAGDVAYGRPSDKLRQYCLDHGLPPKLGDPQYGFLPCLVVHPGLSCASNVVIRWLRGLAAAVTVYLPVHGATTLLLRRKALLASPVATVLRVAALTARSASFLACFISSIWASVCLVRNLLRNDTPWGPLLGAATCGLSVLLEQPSRRHELAMYVVPRALESVWVQLRELGWVRGVRHADVFMFCAATSIVMWCYDSEPENLRPSLLAAMRSYLTWL